MVDKARGAPNFSVVAYPIFTIQYIQFIRALPQFGAISSVSPTLHIRLHYICHKRHSVLHRTASTSTMNSNTSQSFLSDFPFPSGDGSLHPHSNLNAFTLMGPNPVDLVHSSHLGGSPHLWHDHTGYKSIPPWRALGAFSSEVPQSYQQPSCKAPSAATATSTQSHRQTAKHKHTSAQPYHIGDRTRVLPLRKKPSVSAKFGLPESPI